MGQADDTPKKIGELVDRIEQIREELLAIQRSMEKIETVKTAMSDDGVKKGKRCCEQLFSMTGSFRRLVPLES
jgi:hypothetical protein